MMNKPGPNFGSFSPAVNQGGNFDGFITTPAEERVRDAERKKLNDAIEILKVLETDGGKAIMAFLEKEISNYSKSPDSFIHDMEIKIEEVAFHAGALTAFGLVKKYFEDCDRLVTTKAQANASQEVKTSA